MLHKLLNPIKRYFSHPDAVILTSVIFAILFLYVTLGHLLAPVFIAVVIAYLLQWPVGFLERYRVSHFVAVWLVFLAFLTCLVLALVGLIPMLWRQLTLFINELPELFSHGQALMNNLPEKYPMLVSIDQIQRLLDYLRLEFAAMGQALLSYMLSSVPGIFMMIVYLVMVPLLTYFFLMDRDELLALVSYYLPAKRSHLSRLWKEIYDQIGYYVAGRVLEVIIVSAACSILFTLFNLPYASLLGVAVGVSVIIPYLGAIVASVPVLILTLLQWGLDWQFWYLLITYAVILLIDTNILMPMLFSRLIKLHPASIIIAVLLFGGLFGFWGVFFAIPLAAVVKAVINAWPVES